MWAVGKQTQKMIASMKEHKSRVNCVQLNHDDTECVTAAADGSCIVWSLERFVRNTCLFASTQFKSVLYHPDQSQLLTTGTDRKVLLRSAALSAEAASFVRFAAASIVLCASLLIGFCVAVACRS